MKNNTNQIMKLDLPIWIKYWLAKHKNISYILSEILTGTEFFLQDSAPKKFKMFDIIGRTTQESTTGKNLLKIENVQPSNGANVDYTLKFQLEQGSTATDYEPYTGGEPAPNPNYEMPIKNTGDNGSVNEKVQNFNIWDEQWEVGEINGSTGAKANTGSAIRSKNYIRVTPSQTLYIKTPKYCNIYQYDIDKNYISSIRGEINEIFTLSSQCYYILFATSTAYGTSYNNDICINVSNTALNGTYIAHEEQKISFPLAQGQKLMQGDYLADDGIHHVRAQIVLDGSIDENWQLWSITATNVERFYIVNMMIPKQASTSLCSHFKFINDNSDIQHYRFGGSNFNEFIIYIDRTIATSVAELRTWLQSNPITIEYDLAEEVIDPYTEEQKSAWEQIKALKTYAYPFHFILLIYRMFFTVCTIRFILFIFPFFMLLLCLT